MRIFIFDLDEVILDSMGRFQGPVQRRVAEVSGRSLIEVVRAQQRQNRLTFTFSGWFAELGIDPSQHAELESELRTDLAARAQDSVFPGMRELLQELSTKGLLVLVTAGDLGYQQWKISLLGLDVFDPEHHHYVALVDGSKADKIEPYLALGNVAFIDDSPKWMQEARQRFDDRISLIRPRFPGCTFEAEHPDDDKLWATVNTVEQLEALLKWGV